MRPGRPLHQKPKPNHSSSTTKPKTKAPSARSAANTFAMMTTKRTNIICRPNLRKAYGSQSLNRNTSAC